MKVNSYIKSFFVLMSGNVIAQLIPFLFAPFLSRMFTEKEFALQSIFFSIIGIIAVVAGGRYELAVVLPKKQSKAINLVGLSLSIAVIISLVSIVLICFHKQIEALYKIQLITSYIPYVSLGVFLTSIVAILTNWLVRQKKYNAISTLKIIQSIAINGIILCFGYFKFGTDGLIFGWIIGQFITLVMFLLRFSKNFEYNLINKKEMKEVAIKYKDFPTINSLHAFTDILFSQFIITLLITRNFGLAFVGLFFMMNKYLRAPIKVVGEAVGQIYYREANEKYLFNKSVLPNIYQSIKVTSYFAVPVCIILLLLGPEIFQLYLGEKWILSGKYAQIMAVPVFFSFLTAPISTTALIFKKQKTAFLISIVGYAVSASMFLVGVIAGYDFKNTLVLFAIAMSLYYIFLLFWYISLAKNKS